MPVLNAPTGGKSISQSNPLYGDKAGRKGTSLLAKDARRRKMLTSIVDMIERGYSVTQMSRELELPYATAYKMFIRAQKRIHVEQNVAIDMMCSNVSAKYQRIIKELFEAWQCSKTDKDGAYKAPNADYIDRMLIALRDVRKLMGLDKTIEPQQNTTINQLNWDTLLRAGRVVENTLSPAQESDSVEDKIKQLEALVVAETDKKTLVLKK